MWKPLCNPECIRNTDRVGLPKLTSTLALAAGSSLVSTMEVSALLRVVVLEAFGVLLLLEVEAGSGKCQPHFSPPSLLWKLQSVLQPRICLLADPWALKQCWTSQRSPSLLSLVDPWSRGASSCYKRWQLEWLPKLLVTNMFCPLYAADACDAQRA